MRASDLLRLVEDDPEITDGMSKSLREALSRAIAALEIQENPTPMREKKENENGTDGA